MTNPTTPVIDNYDLFTYNLVQVMGELGADLCVIRNDQITLDGIRDLALAKIARFPAWPHHPEDDSGVSLEVLAETSYATPILGVCLGHHAIGQVFGGKVVRALRLMHGNTSPGRRQETPLFTGVPSPFEATRYHSLIVEEPAAGRFGSHRLHRGGRGHGPRHKDWPVVGVQFHPESIPTGVRPAHPPELLPGWPANGAPGAYTQTGCECRGHPVNSNEATDA